jgi:hypothetical protein
MEKGRVGEDEIVGVILVGQGGREIPAVDRPCQFPSP